MGVLEGDEAEQAALLSSGKGKEGDDGPGRKALNQSRNEEKKAYRGTRRKPVGLCGGLRMLRAYPGNPQPLGP